MNRSILGLLVIVVVGLSACMKPMADFSMNSEQAAAPATVDFTNTSKGAKEYHWDFGDGEQSMDSTANHRYTNAGKYDVTLTAKKGKKSNSMTKKSRQTMVFGRIMINHPG